MPNTKAASLSADELAEAIRSGSSNYTAADLAAARAAEEFEALRLEARSREEVDRLAQERVAAKVALRAEIAAITDDVDEQLACVAAIMAAFDDLVASSQARIATIAELGDRARELGIAQLDAQGNVSDDVGVGWKFSQRDRRVGRLRVGDRVLSSVDPRTILAKVVEQLVNRHRLDADPVRVPHGVTVVDLIRGQDETIAPPEMVAVRLRRRHGHRPAGTTATYEAGTAEWLITKGFAERP